MPANRVDPSATIAPGVVSVPCQGSPRPDGVPAARTLLDTLPVYVWMKDREGRYVDANAAYAAAVGLNTTSAIVGLTDADLWPHDLAVAFRAADEQVVSTWTSVSLEERIETSGVPRWYETIRRPWFGPDGDVVGTIGVSHDVTQRRQVQEVIAARLRLVNLAPRVSLDDLLRATLDEAEHLTGSPIGFYHFVAPDQRSLVLQAWSTRTSRDFCRAEGKGLHYSIDEAGVWVDCIRERRPVIHNDYLSLPHKRGLPEGHADILRELVVPVLREGLIVAVMGVGNRQTPYSDDDVAATSQLADLAWDIADRKRSDDALRESEQRYRELFEAESDAILLVDEASGCVLEANSSACAMYGYTRDELVAMHEGDLSGDATAPGAGSLRGRPPGTRPALSYHRRRGGTIFPVEVAARKYVTSGHPITIVTVRDVSERQRYEEQLAEQHRRLAEAYESLQSLVVTDSLTGLLNRRAYDARVVDERARASRGKSLSILMIDVDHFKDFNDTFGHAAGDEVLARLGRLLLGATRGTDSVARYGGEEFVVIAPDADSDAAAHLAERCRAAAEMATWPKRRITISVGVATWTRDMPASLLEDLPLAADRALYYAKRTGRNRVAHADAIDV